MGNLLVRINTPFALIGVGGAYQMRGYVAKKLERTDHRVSGYTRLTAPVTDVLGITGGYTLTKNFSKNKTDQSYDYIRHMGQIGVEIKW